MTSKFDVLVASAIDLQKLLEAGLTSSVEIVNTYLDQIEKHNRQGLKLRAIISAAPRELAVRKAKELDDERINGKVRSPFHGVPIIVKDALMTKASMGMDTTSGAFVFAGIKGKRNADAIDLLIAKGMIIIGKANMTEFCGIRARNLSPGYSAYGGQTLSAYVQKQLEDSPFACSTSGGSSSGSAVGVAAGFAPVSLGTQTGGSNIYPASRSSLFGMVPTIGNSSMKGVSRLSRGFDSIGTMAKTVEDLAILTEMVLNPDVQAALPEGGYFGALSKSWNGISVGFMEWDTKKWGGNPEVVRTFQV